MRTVPRTTGYVASQPVHARAPSRDSSGEPQSMQRSTPERSPTGRQHSWPVWLARLAPVNDRATARGAPTAFDSRRPALDGVRAVAVLAVIGYHVGSRLPGGFLGVDVFFVLSGYLITTLILRERAARGRIDLARFWARRARRLLPAGLLLVAACALMTTHNVPVSEFEARRGDMLATVFYYANWHFIAASESYFALFVGRSPLEHTWSLAIEEQFYVLWPLLVMSIGLLRPGVRASLGLIVAGVAASAAWMVAIYDPTNPTRAYIGTDTRAHTLLIGALLAVVLFGRPGLLTSDRARRHGRRDRRRLPGHEPGLEPDHTPAR